MIPVESKERKTDRILVLKIKDGEKPKSSTGLIDPRLFKGDNRLHAKLNLRSRLWSLHYDKGSVPPALAMQFTTFDTLMRTAKQYFENRNIEIEKVLD